MPATTHAPANCADFWFDLDDTAGFAGKAETRMVGALALSQVAAQHHSVDRRSPLAPSGGGEHWLLAMQRRGTGILEQHGRKLVLSEGEMLLFAPAQPYRLVFAGPFQQTVVKLAAGPMRALCPEIDVLLGSVMNCRQPQVALLAAMADCYFGTDYAAQPARAAQHAADALRLTLAGCALARPAQTAQTADASGGLSQYHLDRIRKFALAHLGDSELSITQVVDALGISAAHIHRLFAAESQSFSAWLWETRLMFCHLALRNPGMAKLSIGQIAYKFGYSHPAHFSRAYRTRFGMTPSAWRQG